MAEGVVGYVLKGYPRLSELFIASEIWRLEQLGRTLALFVLKPADEQVSHPVVGRIAARPAYLPATTPLSGQPLLPWLRHNLGPFRPALLRIARRHPVRLARAVAAAAAQSGRARKGWRPRTIYVKELLQAVEVADRISQADGIYHLHAHFAHGTTTVTWLASMLTGLPFSFTGHAKDIYRESLNPAGLLARKMRAAAFVVTCTATNRDHLRALAPDADVRLIYHGLNADFARLLAEVPPRDTSTIDLSPSCGPLRIVSVGRLVAKKGFGVLVDAVAVLHERGQDVELVIVGEDGEDAASVRAQVAAHKLSDVVSLLGPLSQRDICMIYRRCDVFALACRIEANGDRDGIPNVLVEAMAAGLPVVSTAVSGIPELVRDGHNGLLVAPDDPVALADALLRLAKDPQLRACLARAGAVTVSERFDGDLLARHMATLLTEQPR
ncbi:MAG: glycosyltransferase family 4 protein [Actinomycetota bacterium]|nr:glycosyltransferase family 4 protein [Actinomycetota bacterium]